MKARIRQHTVPLFVGEFETLEMVNKVSEKCQTFNPGEIVFITSEEKYYKYSQEQKWEEFKIKMGDNKL